MSLPTLLVPGKHKSYPRSKEMPIDLLIKDIEDVFKTSNTYYLSARTGSGKTTIIPPRILKLFHTRTLVCEPTVNLAISSVDSVLRNAPELSKGKNIGYVTGPEKLYPSEQNSIVFCTYKVATLTISNSTVEPPIIIIDEAHTKDIPLIELLQNVRDHPDIKVIIMSATLDVELMKFYFKTSRPLTEKNYASIDGLTNYEVKTYNHPCEDFEDAAFTIKSYMKEDMINALVFIPTIRYAMNIIRLIDGDNIIKPTNMTETEYKRALKYHDGRSVYVVFPYGMTKNVPDICRSILDKFTRPPNVKYIIFGTNALETGRTIPKLTHMFDFGLLFYRINDPIATMNDTISGRPTNFNGKVVMESEDNRIQREGRVGRICPGTVVRMYDKDIEFKLNDDIMANQKLMIDYTIDVMDDNEQNDLFDYNDYLYIPSFDTIAATQVDWQRANIITHDGYKIAPYQYDFNTPLRIALTMTDQFDLRSALYIAHINFVYNFETCSTIAPKIDKCLADYESLDPSTCENTLLMANETYNLLLQANSNVV